MFHYCFETKFLIEKITQHQSRALHIFINYFIFAAFNPYYDQESTFFNPVYGPAARASI